MSLTAARLDELLTYDAETGVLRWRVQRAYVVRAGDMAGTDKTRRGVTHRVIIADGGEVQSHVAAWALHYGELPSRAIIHLNGNRRDNRISNLIQLEPASVGHNLDAATLRRLLAYDPETGIFTWLRPTAQRNSPGDVANAKPNSDGYEHISIGKVSFKVHRLAWLYVHGEWPDRQIDHINGVRHDNRLCNLRLAERNENAKNRKLNANNKSGHKGVYWHSSNGKWHACIRSDGQRHNLGFFDCVEDAARAYKLASERLHREFRRVC
jgi:hypothetical protein